MPRRTTFRSDQTEDRDDDDVVFFRRSPGKRTTPFPTPKDVYDDEKNANWWCERNGKTRKDDDEHDEEADAELEATQFGRYFPTFTWVLRDFSLELVDERGSMA